MYRFWDEGTDKRRKISDYCMQNINSDRVFLLVNYQLSLINSQPYVLYLCVISTKKRDGFKIYLLDNGIQVLIHYIFLPQKTEAYDKCINDTNSVLEQIYLKVLSLFIYPIMSFSTVDSINNAINSFSGLSKGKILALNVR